ncbi:condensation domain-containing protein [Catellatospora sp. KI3]|uniref:condensation domain-containing protein n=1 Tax=Catellatospora sp. KI3 TaxID=3041620 RepID=UPI0024829EC9|nr:condensation domain-containing protein [Catellatospora sp. KI3]MDI1462556.1 condensation domain-containing protein [Catellatospora sp. KI3]
MTTVNQIMVPFHGEGSGTGELSWGQREIWAAMRRQQSAIPVGGCLPLPDGTTLDDMVAELRFNMSRHQTMRTRLEFGADGRPRQVVAASGEIALEVVDADGADPAEVGEQLRQRYWTTGYDYAAEWPLRMGVVVSGGVPTHVVVVFHHLVSDGFGSLVLMTDLAERDPATGAAGSPPALMQPLEQARWQATPAGVRQHEMAMRHWEGLLRAIPARRFAGSDDPREPRYWEGELISPAMHAAVRIIAARTATDSGAVLLAAFAVVLARLTAVSPAVVRTVVSNRFRPGLANVVSPVNQTSLCVLDVADATFDEVVRRTRQRSMAAYKYAYYDPERLSELVAGVERERGEPLDISCFFNDRRVRHRDDSGPVPTAAQVEAAADRTAFRWLRQQDQPFERLFVHVEDEPDTLVLTVCGDTRHVSPADLRACLTGMAALAVEAALDPATRTGV